jgi:hypothetical protein
MAEQSDDVARRKRRDSFAAGLYINRFNLRTRTASRPYPAKSGAKLEARS